ncbi:MAG: prepilin-type N-terminal cleavage/methylation domain-containing protein [Planctomycetaceae bacterium]|jgi:prepilin-type N-terminal cleavage/methylation domain-containing protein|nr:prepilin-type N-terminal cleavage/methylation domain-containing protein [Planctomycetaceae bacterium]
MVANQLKQIQQIKFRYFQNINQHKNAKADLFFGKLVLTRIPKFVKCGFTLVEILIALVLMLIILGIISVSIDIYLRQMVINRSEVEEAQLARALLDRISQEIRSVVVRATEELATEEINVELLISIFGNSTTTGNSNAATNLPANNTTANSNSTTNTTSTPTENEQSTESTVSVKGTLPGIYGDLDWIQIDTVRLPRGEFFGSRRRRVGSQFQTDRLSSTKTVYYYLGKDTGTIADTTDPRYNPDQLIGSLGRLTDMTALQYGLFRREFDRQVTQYLTNEGKESDYEQYDEVIAPEVEWIEFAYFDASATTSTNPEGDWVEYWDMDEKKTFPKAIKITIAIRKQIFGNALLKLTESTGETVPTNIYSKIVILPVEIKKTETTTENENEL